MDNQIITADFTVTAEEKREETTVTAPQKLKENQLVQGYREYFKLAQTLATSDIIPDVYKNKPANIVIALDMANRMAITPMMVMQNLYVVRGKPSWSGQACKSLIQGCGKFKNVKTIYIGERGTDGRGCYISAVGADGEKIDGPDVTIAIAKAEGWYGSNPKWRNLTELMLAYRAAAFFARVHCPEVLMGVHVEGEVEDFTTEPANPEPKNFL